MDKLDYVSTVSRSIRFCLKVKYLGSNQFEIAIFNPTTPARAYSTGVLKIAGDFLKWAS